MVNISIHIRNSPVCSICKASLFFLFFFFLLRKNTLAAITARAAAAKTIPRTTIPGIPPEVLEFSGFVSGTPVSERSPERSPQRFPGRFPKGFPCCSPKGFPGRFRPLRFLLLKRSRPGSGSCLRTVRPRIPTQRRPESRRPGSRRPGPLHPETCPLKPIQTEDHSSSLDHSNLSPHSGMNTSLVWPISISS